MKVLVLGASGAIGKHVVAELGGRGHVVRTLMRAARRRTATGDIAVGDLRDPEVVATAADGADAIINCAGASVALGFGYGWRGYRVVDVPIGLTAVSAARRTGARLVYVGVHHDPALARGAYIDAHERVVAAMGDVDGTVVRATGFFSAFAALLPFARRGVLFDVGPGRTRTNPIAEEDLARVVVDAMAQGGPREMSAGGPEVMTRRELFEQVAAAAGGPVRILRMPVWLVVAMNPLVRMAHPRIGQFAEFAVGLAHHDCIAPAMGTARLTDHLRRVATDQAA